MITYVNYGPGRSGSTSFYNMCLENKSFNCGKEKEPVDTRWRKIGDQHLYNLDITSYIDNWEYDISVDNLLLDGSGQLLFAQNIKEFKKYMDRYVDSFKFILLVRDPKLYFISRLYINFLTELNEEFNIKDDLSNVSINYVIELLMTKLKNTSFFNRFSYLQILRYASSILNTDEIFILPIEFYDDYKSSLSAFLNIDCSSLKIPHHNTVIIKSNKNKILKSIIESNILNNKTLDIEIKNDFKIIDSEYKTNLYNIYLN